MSAPERADFATPVGGLTALAGAGALVPLRSALDHADVALALAAIVVGAAALGGRRAGAVTAVVAALSFDFLHTEPYQSLKMANGGDALTAGLLLVLGVVAGLVAEELHRVRRRRSLVGELHRLHRVAARASSGDSSEDLTLQVSAELLEALHLRGCWYEALPFDGDLPVLGADGSLGTHRWWSAELPRRGAAIPVRSAGRLVGRFVLAPTPGVAVDVDRRAVAVTLVEQLELVLALRSA